MIPPRTILAPIDFSDASRLSLECAARLAARWSAALHVMHAIDPLLAAAAGSRRVDLAGSTRDELVAFSADAAWAGPLAGAHVTVGAAAESICETAERLGADLIVTGARGLTGLNRLVMGTTVEHVIRRSTRPVLTVPGHRPSADSAICGPVIAAVEHPDDPGLVAAAAALAASLDAPLHVVHVVPPLAAPARWRAEADTVIHASVEDARRRLSAAMGALGPAPANVHVTTGPVADTLAAEVSRHSDGMAVLMLGRNPPGGGYAPGSVASRVIARATAAVWVHLPDA